MPADPADAGDAEYVDGEGAPQGLSWSYELDFGALIAALAGVDPPGAADTDAANAANAATGMAAQAPAPRLPARSRKRPRRKPSSMSSRSWMRGQRRRAG